MAHSIIVIIGKILLWLKNNSEALISRAQIAEFADCGEDVHVGKNCSFIPSHIHCGSHVSIGARCSFFASIAHIYIGNYVLFGPNVTIRGGNHAIGVKGKHIYEVKDEEKKASDDSDVIIGDGVWVGCNVTILKGVTIGKGTVVGAGSVVTKNTPPLFYCSWQPGKNY